MRIKDQGRIEDNLQEGKCIPSFYISRTSRLKWERSGRTRNAQGQTYASFYAEKLLCELACELDQNPMGLTIRVPEQGHHNVAIAQV